MRRRSLLPLILATDASAPRDPVRDSTPMARPGGFPPTPAMAAERPWRDLPGAPAAARRRPGLAVGKRLPVPSTIRKRQADPPTRNGVPRAAPAPAP
jgi:hypothetical protein